MIRCTLELVPANREPELLGVIEISNRVGRTIATGGSRGDYGYEIFKKRKGVPWKRGSVLDFPRRSYHPWNLVLRILKQAAENNGGII